MDAPVIPSELVEAAAKALAGEWHMVAKDLRARWDSVLPDDNPGVPENWLARAVLSAVVPLIQQAERDRLAKQAGEGVQRLRDAIHTADRELITIADFSIQEAADAIDNVRAGLKDALAETDRSAQDEDQSVPDQSLQAVIDRLTIEAGSKRARTSQLHRIVTLDVAVEAVREGAACGVAAERARIRRLIATLYDGPPAQHPVIVEILEALEDK